MYALCVTGHQQRALYRKFSSLRGFQVRCKPHLSPGIYRVMLRFPCAYLGGV